MVEWQRSESCARLGAAGDGCDFAGRIKLSQEACQEFGGSRRQLRRLEHHTVASRKCRHQRHDCELKRIIPRADDAHNSEGLIEDSGAAWQKLQTHAYAFRLHPGHKMMKRVP